jgi:hypothetical protein
MSTIINGSSPSITFSDGSTQSTAVNITAPYTSNGVVYASSTTALATVSNLKFNGTNLGLGGSLNTNWDTVNYNALQIGVNGSLISTSANNNYIYVAANAYLNNGFKYISTNANAVSAYSQSNGTHNWFTAPSGTADNAISFTQSLSLGRGTTLALEGATSVSGTGISFPATQNPSSDANTLDDYEEGTFTPIIGGSGTFGTTTYQFSPNVNSEYGGRYTKIGNMVYCQIAFGIASVSGGTGVVMIAGLPFTATASPTPYASFMFGTINNITHSGSRTQFGARTNNNTTNAYMWEFGLASGSIGDTPVAYSALCPSGSATNITCSVVYQTS